MPPKILATQRKSALRQRAIANGYRSGLEDAVSTSLHKRGCKDFDYEQHTLRYTIPSRVARYTPDFVLPNGIVVETKGWWWPADDRKKIALVVQDWPSLDLRIVFSNPQTPISKGSKTTYAMVCEKFGIPFAKGDIPLSWLEEPPNGASLALLENMRK
jgi:hypothetical protein